MAAADRPLRHLAKHLGVDAAILCRPLTDSQADRFAVKLGMHPIEIWGTTWWD